MIFLIGDRPSKKNVDPKVPFVGTNSYKTLLQWIARLDVDITEVVLANKEHVVDYSSRGLRPDVHTPAINIEIWLEKDSVIALGNEASKYLNSLNIEHFKLPHPSGRNLRLNDKKYVDKVLKECKDYLNRR
jgi:uracil-DNA glycosylase